MKFATRILVGTGLFLSLAMDVCFANSMPLQLVAIKDYQFVPATVVIAPGTTVMWTNADASTHTVTALDKSWSSGQLSSGSSYRHEFKTAGTYSYYCAIQPSMTGKVIVSTSGH